MRAWSVPLKSWTGNKENFSQRTSWGNRQNKKDAVEFEASTRAHQLERTLALIDDNAIHWIGDGSTHVGKPEIEQALRTSFETIENEEYRISEIVWVLQSADVAACIFSFEWSGSVRGSPASECGRGTSVLARKADTWVVVHESLSKGSTQMPGRVEATSDPSV